MIRQFHRNESSWNLRSQGTKVPQQRKFQGANVPWNESSTGAKVLSVDFSLPGTKVQRNEKAWNLQSTLYNHHFWHHGGKVPAIKLALGAAILTHRTSFLAYNVSITIACYSVEWPVNLLSASWFVSELSCQRVCQWDVCEATFAVANMVIHCGRYTIVFSCGRCGCGRYGLWPIWYKPCSTYRGPQKTCNGAQRHKVFAERLPSRARSHFSVPPVLSCFRETPQ